MTSKLQKCLSISTAGDELNDAVKANKEAILLENLLPEIDLELQEPLNVFVNKLALLLV